VYLLEALLLVQHTRAFHLPFLPNRYTSFNMVATRRAASSKAAAAVHTTPKTPPPSKVPGRSSRSRSTKQTTLVASSPIDSLKPIPTVVTPSSTPSSSANTTTTNTNNITNTSTGRPLLFSLKTDDELVRATFVVRPSKRNKSPYVADILMLEEEGQEEPDTQREAIAHVPNLDMGGKCVPGVTLLLKPARNPKGVKVGANGVSPKYGTPKCEFITQLLHVDESWIHPDYYPPTWVGAHPSLGERIAEECLNRSISSNKSSISNNDSDNDNSLHQLLGPTMSDIVSIQKQIHNPCGAEMRSDFLVTHASGQKRIVEVKTVVDTDYSSAFPPPTTDATTTATAKTAAKKKKGDKIKCLFTSDQMPYRRTAIFPWGNSNQKGPDGEKVVSTRAIHHMRELTRIANGELVATNDADADADLSETGTGTAGERYKATILFVVIRGDAESFRPNVQACPSFGRYLRLAEQAGVEILVKRVSWGNGEQEGMCFDDKLLPIEWPNGY
jgi:hypothetical protein